MISTPPTTTPQPSASSAMPAPSAGRPSGRRYPIIFGSIFTLLTVLALGLAAFAPELGATPNQPSFAGWNALYQRDLTTADTAAWDITHGCVFSPLGLDASASASDPAICTFTPAGEGGATGAGFYFEVKLTPAAKVQSFERAMLLLGDTSDQTGNTIIFAVGKDGNYVICDGACVLGRGLYLAGGTAAWHSDAFVPNTIALQVSADHTHETFFVNGQQVGVASDNLGPSPALAAGAPQDSEAIFTYATFSTGQ